ncbi:MAG TPA: DUF1028 domain-containing protein [Candidatus Limnocylindria bacterium]|jgi:uncharacterized Ntn-hydrolase superfamily protein|nr:DUF1028 domain-containing protein [Candidatus Limnocylindria bacterium]
MTYSIVARDPATGRFGIAVQSHYLGVGPVVPWLEAGVGAIATQAQVDISFGPIGLELLRNGRTAEQTVAALLASDPTPQVRQLGVVDGEGHAFAHTGTDTIPAAGHLIGEGFTVQGNLLERDTCWPAMKTAYESATAEGLPFSERLLRAMEAAEGEGGDVRGRQSSAIMIVEGTLQPVPWKGRVLDARVDDHPDPVPELRRLVDLYEAYDLLDPEKGGVSEAEGYAEARRRAPEAYELVFWMGIEHAKRGEIDDARRELAIAFAADARWRTTLRHLADAGREGMNPEMAAKLTE